MTSPEVGFEVLRVKERDAREYVRLQQTYAGIPVFAGEVIVQIDGEGGVCSIASDIARDTSPLDHGRVSIQAGVPPDAALAQVRSVYAAETGAQLALTTPRLMWFAPSVVGIPGEIRLVWVTRVSSVEAPQLAADVLVDAHAAAIVQRFPRAYEARNRQVYDANYSAADPGTLARAEGDPASAIAEVNKAYDYLGDTYNFYSTEHGRDSIDNLGLTLSGTVRYCPSACPFNNGLWSGGRMYIGDGFAVDDVIAHELTHGVTSYESGLIYANTSGAINESFSDVWGEFVDLGNGHGNDAVSVRWYLGEDAPGGSVRYMKTPSRFSAPDRLGSTLYVPPVATPEFSNDYGGVHANSGVNNKLCYLLTDGDTFNGRTIHGLGISRVADLYYEVQTSLLTSGADWTDLSDALAQAAVNLNWSQSDRDNVFCACVAVEIAADSLPPVCPTVVGCHDGVWGPAEYCGRDAYVVTGTPDMNHDCVVDRFLDVGLFGEDSGAIGPNHSGDFNDDNYVDSADVITLALHMDETAIPCTPGGVGQDMCQGAIALSFDEDPNNIVSTLTLPAPGIVLVYVVCSGWADAQAMEFALHVTGSASVLWTPSGGCADPGSNQYSSRVFNYSGWPNGPVVVANFALNVTATTPVTIELRPVTAPCAIQDGKRLRWTDSAYNRSIDFASVRNAGINTSAPPATPTCAVGLNVDLLSPAAAAASGGLPTPDGVEFVYAGRSTALGHVDAWFPNFAVVQDPDTTLVRWTGHAVPAGTKFHVGVTMQGDPPLLGIRWLSGNTILGCAQVLTGDGTHGGVIKFFGLPSCSSGPALAAGPTLYVSDLHVEWHASSVALGDLLGSVQRSPIRDDFVPGVFAVQAGESLDVHVPLPAPGAREMVLAYRVADSPTASLYSRSFSQSPAAWIDTTNTVDVPIGPPPAVDTATLRFSRPPRNPAVGRLEFSLTARTAVRAEISVLDVSGRRVTTLYRGPMAIGERRFEWNGVAATGRRCPAGVYWLRIVTDEKEIARRFVLLR